MQGEHFILDNCRQWKVLEDLCEEFPYRLSPILLNAFIVEAIIAIDFAVLMVTPEEGDAAAVFDLEDEDVQEGLYAIEAAIHIVAHEEEVSFLRKNKEYGKLAADFEYLQQVVELPVDVATHGHRGPHWHHVGLFHQDFLHLG